MSWSLLVICLSVQFLGEVQSAGREWQLVEIEQGPVRGYKDPVFDLYSFQNIPYATVTERYKAPSPPPNWTEPFDAIDRGIICPQGPVFYINMNDKLMQEDCLVVNVFVPVTEQDNLPVLLNIHGGAYQVGYGNNEVHRTFAATKNIITVNFNYRVGILGFLCLGTENAPGNAGMKDQLALLRWVKKNIASFGGNPDDITVSACSAGSGSLNLLTLSDTTKGLFNRIISDSGGSVGAFAVQVDPIENAKSSAIALNFTNADDLDALEEFYRTVSLDVITSRNFMVSPNSGVTFGPCVERDVGVEMFLTDAPYNILVQGDYERYPTMYGITNMEGLQRMSRFAEWSVQMNEKFSDFLPADLQFESEEEKEEVAETVKQFYFGTEPVTEASALAYIDFFTDVVFGYSMQLTVKLHLEAGNNTIYYYEYSFYDDNTNPVLGTDVKGANHCNQAAAVFDQNESRLTEEYKIMKDTMRDIWANFILEGEPVPEGSPLPSWPPVGDNRSPHMSIGRTIELRGPLNEERALFWDDIYGRYYRAPEAPAASASTTTTETSTT